MAIRTFILRKSSSGIILVLTSFLALLISNSPLGEVYHSLLTLDFGIRLGEFKLDKPILIWVNDGLMAIFFFLIGLEVKREVLQGELSSPAKAAMPVVAAIGGIIVPAVIYMVLNHGDEMAMQGWAIPVATDIAFALGVLALLGPRIPRALKVLLLSLAIIDDIAAILIIAIFYSHGLSVFALVCAGIGFFIACLMNHFKVRSIAAYVLVGVAMWLCVVQSGMHATLTGVLLAMTIPLSVHEAERSPSIDLEHSLHPWVAFMILPIFAFMNAGVRIFDVSLFSIFDPMSMGIFFGLFLGKQLGVFSFVFIGHLIGICRKPESISWMQLYGLSVLTGIGFTMSLFIGVLAFDDPVINAQVRIAIFLASFASAVLGYVVLRFSRHKSH